MAFRKGGSIGLNEPSIGNEVNNELLFSANQELSASYLSNYALKIDETQIILVSRNSPFSEILEQKIAEKSDIKVRVVDSMSSTLLNDPIFFVDSTPSKTRKMLSSIFLLRENEEYDDTKLVQGILRSVVRYLLLRNGSATIREVCATASLFFDKPLGDEEEYANRLDEIIEVFSTGVHVNKDDHRSIPGCRYDETLARSWRSIRGYFKKPSDSSSVAAKLQKVLEPYMSSEIDGLDSLASNDNQVVVINVDTYDGTRDGLALAYLRCLLDPVLRESANHHLNGPVKRLIIENVEDKPTIPGFTSLIRLLLQNHACLDLHYSSLPGFYRKHSDQSSEIKALFESQVYLMPSDPDSFREIQIQTGLSLSEIQSKSRGGGWLLAKSNDLRYITWKKRGAV